jgi:hypothetical protein
MSDENVFWMVWNPQGSQPTAKHYQRTDALAEAERLARKCPGETFYVLEATELRRVDAMQRIPLVHELPF